MQTLLRLTLWLTLIASAGLLPAQEQPAKFDPAARAKVIAPFIDEQAFAVARIDISRIEADTAFCPGGRADSGGGHGRTATGEGRFRVDLDTLQSGCQGRVLRGRAGQRLLRRREPNPVFAIVPFRQTPMSKPWRKPSGRWGK